MPRNNAARLPMSPSGFSSLGFSGMIVKNERRAYTMSKKKKSPRQSGQQQPQWRPISFLPTLAQHIDGMLAADIEQYETLLFARSKPHVLDDYTVNRVIAAFTTQRNDFGLFEEQLRRWLAEPLTEGQNQEVTRLVEQMKVIRENNVRVLALADELAKGTIEMQLAKSDLDLGLEALLNPDILRRG
jgi:hypothetical protein